ncbi:hypothetical protein [Streptomyces sp. NPDC051776]
MEEKREITAGAAAEGNDGTSTAVATGGEGPQQLDATERGDPG